jgi:PST family polysaccharide transporter
MSDVDSHKSASDAQTTAAKPRVSAVNSAAVLGGSQAIKLGLNVLTTIVVARVLAPIEYGVSAMVAPIMAFIYLAQDFGFSVTTVQQPTLRSEESSAMFWLNVGASVGLALMLLALAPAVAWFYEDVRAGYATATAAPSILVSSLALQHTALLTRHMRFTALAACELIYSLVAFIATALLAYWLRTYWALILGAIVGVVFHSLALWRACDFRPAWPPSVRAARGMLRSGGQLTGAGFLNFLVRNADNVMVAKFWGPVAAGLYDRCYRLMMLPLQNINGPLTRLLLPLLSRNQAAPVAYRRHFLLAARGVMLASAPAVAIGAATSVELMPFLLGPKWVEAGPIFFWLGMTGLLQPISSLALILLISRGRARHVMMTSAASAVLTLGAFSIGLSWGAKGVATAFFLSTMIRIPPTFYICAKDCPVTQLDLWRVQLEPLLGAAVAALIAHRLLGFMPLLETLALTLPLSYVLSLGTSIALSRDGRTQTLELLSIAKQLVSRTRLANWLPSRSLRS